MELTSIVEYDEDLDEYFIALPQEIVDYLQLSEDDELDWTLTAEGARIEKRE